jgi:phage gp46-like protein
MTQQGDVALRHTPDGGEINVENGTVEMSGGLETAAYLSLFGGNEDDDGRDKSPLAWWGNVGEEVDKQHRSRTQYLLRSIPAIPANLRRIEDAAKSDLDWFISSKAASSVTVVATMPALNTVKLTVRIYAEGDPARFDFTENWTASE